MLKKRIIFTLIYDQQFFMLSRNFRLQKVGNLSWLKKHYDFSQIAFSIDELIVLDVSRENRDGKAFAEHVKKLNEKCFVPIAAGGGIRTVEQARSLLRSGADKIVLNTLLAMDPQCIWDMAAEFGRQCIIASVDIKSTETGYGVWIENGTTMLKQSVREWFDCISRLPIGEIYLNSISRDGTGQGYEKEVLNLIPDGLNVPIILAGGAGKYHHLAIGLQDDRVDAVATTHLFNFVGDGLVRARKELLDEGFDLAVWDQEKMKELDKCLTRRERSESEMVLGAVDLNLRVCEME
jgi:cyclase